MTRMLHCLNSFGPRAVLIVVFLATSAAVGQEHQPASQSQSKSSTGDAKPPTCRHCCKCGVEILQTPDAFDDEGRPLCSRCAAKLAATKKQQPKPYDILTTKKLTGDWGGARTKLTDAGINFSLLLGTMSQINFRGGLNTHNAHETGGKAFWNLELDFEKMAGLKGATFFGRCIQTWNSGIGRHVGSLTPPYWGAGSGGDQAWALDKWWYRQRLFDDRLEFRLGKLLNICDLFDKNTYADNYLGKFMNRAFNHNMTIPTTKGLGAFIRVWPVDWLYVQGMVVDPDYKQTTCSHGWGGFDTAFGGEDRFRAFWEFGILPKFTNTANCRLPGHYRFGWWLDPQPKTIFIDDLGGLRAQQRRSGDMGFYFNFDQMIWKENNDPKDKQGLGVFARYGWAHRDVNKINHFWSAGAAYQGLIPSRGADVLGLGVAQSILSSQYRHNIDSRADRETVYELYYAIKVTPWCVVTPDIQVITNPGGDRDARDALVGGVRVKIAF